MIANRLRKPEFLAYSFLALAQWLKSEGELEGVTMEYELPYNLEDALTDLASVQLIDNTWKEAAIVRQEIEEIMRKLAGSGP